MSDDVLKNFMQEFFPFEPFNKVGIFTDEMKDDYEAQAYKICKFFGFKTVYEYRAETIRCHISYAKGKRPKGEGFITEIKSIYL